MTLSRPGEAKNQVFFGTFIHAKSLGELEYLHNAAVCVDASGKIVAVETNCNQQKAVETVYARLGWSLDNVTVTVARDANQFYFPGFIGRQWSSHIAAYQA
jgi:guanine deaminase